MIVQLKRAAKIWHKAGDIVEVSPAEGQFLLGVGSAAAVEAEAKPAKKPAKKKKAEAEEQNED